MSTTSTKIAIDCDDVATDLKQVIVDHLKKKGFDITDLNYQADKENAYYPEIGHNLARKIRHYTD